MPCGIIEGQSWVVPVGIQWIITDVSVVDGFLLLRHPCLLSRSRHLTVFRLSISERRHAVRRFGRIAMGSFVGI